MGVQLQTVINHMLKMSSFGAVPEKAKKTPVTHLSLKIDQKHPGPLKKTPGHPLPPKGRL